MLDVLSLAFSRRVRQNGLDRLLVMLCVPLMLCMAGAAQAQLPPITYVAGPHGDTSSTKSGGAGTPGWYHHPAGMSLMARHADGRIETLVAGHEVMPDRTLTSVAWVSEQLQDRYLYYEHHAIDTRGAKVADIWRLDLVTRERDCLTDATNEWDPPRGTDKWAPFPTPTPAEAKAWNAAGLVYNGFGIGVWNGMPCEAPGGRIVFCSNRRVVRPPKESGGPAMQLFAMDIDGKNVECIGFINFGGALHPTLMSDGAIAFSSGEMQGLRGGGGNFWGIWSIYPDGGQWGPLVSALGPSGAPIHFQAEMSDGALVWQRYYDTQINGPFYRSSPFAAGPFSAPTMFGDPDHSKNPTIFGRDNTSFGFQRRDTKFVFPDVTGQDVGPLIVDGLSVGTLGQPFALPGNAMGFTWRRGGKRAQTDSAFGEIGIYLWPDSTQQITHPTQPIKIVDEPGVMECMARYLGPLSDVYGATPPVKSYPKTDDLPEGSPFALLGTGSLDYRETQTFANKGLRYQGGDKGVATDRIEYIAVVSTRATESFGTKSLPLMNGVGISQSKNFNGFGNEFNERLSFYEPLVPATKWRMPDGSIEYGAIQPEGGVMILGPDGKRDTSFQCYIPANQPWTLAYFDANGDQLGLAQTWHQAMSREEQNKCKSCHGHNQPPPFETHETLAWAEEYERLWLTSTQPVTEYWQDVRPIFEARGVVDAVGAFHTRQTLFAAGNKDFLAARSPLITSMRANAYPGMTDAEIAAVSAWIATGMTEAGLEVAGGTRLTPETMRGPWADTNPPTLVVVPERRPSEPVTQIVIGAADPDSGLNVESLSVLCDFAVNGRPVGEELIDLFTRDDAQSTWTLALDAPVTTGSITASVRDNQQARKVDGTPLGEAGNETRVVRSFTVVGSEPGSAPMPKTASASRAR